MNIEIHKNNLKKYIEEDMAFKEPLKNISDFDKYCYNHCLDIKEVLSELDKKDKRLKRQFKIITKRDKQIEEIKQIAHNDFEERCKLTFKIEELENKLDKQEKIIKLMANEIYITAIRDDGTHFSTKQEVIEYFTNKVEEGKGN